MLLVCLLGPVGLDSCRRPRQRDLCLQSLERSPRTGLASASTGRYSGASIRHYNAGLAETDDYKRRGGRFRYQLHTHLQELS